MNDINESELEDSIAAPAELAELRRDCPPETDLWPGIESVIHARRGRAWRLPLWAGAALAASLVVTLSISVLHGQHRTPPLHAPADIAAAQLTGAHNAALLAVVNHPLHPETRALVRANLKIVNNAEAQLKRALAEDPDGEYLKSLMASARSQQTQLAALEDRR